MEMAKVLGLAIKSEKMPQKPRIMSRMTNDMIYERFGIGFVKEIQARNPKNEHGERLLYHHQLIKESAEDQLRLFFRESIDIMKKCHGMGRVYLMERLKKHFGKSWQMDLFEPEKN